MIINLRDIKADRERNTRNQMSDYFKKYALTGSDRKDHFNKLIESCRKHGQKGELMVKALEKQRDKI